MILTPDQIKEIIIKNPNGTLVKQAKDDSKVLRMHINGVDINLKPITGMESEAMRALRLIYTKSNKDLFSRLSRPIDKVFSARGGSIYYNLPEQADKKARQIAGNVRDGYTVKQWNEHFWKPHFLDDPNGMIFIEIDADGKAYPTFKSIDCVYDYAPRGIKFDYVVFKVSKEEKQKLQIDPAKIIYRVVDDMFDYYVENHGEDVTILDNHTYPNYFMEVPAMVNSDIPSPMIPGLKLSFFHDVIELAEDFMVTGSIQKTHNFKHGFPKYWEYGDSCGKCAGTGFVAGDTCPECKGTKKAGMTKVSDMKLLAFPEKDDQIVTPNVGGYIEPSDKYHKISSEKISSLESEMYITAWGTEPRKRAGNSGGQGDTAKTATEVIDDYQPMVNRLNAITNAAENRHKFILDMCIRINLQQNYKGSSVNYGRRYMLEGPDAIWKKYSEARKEGSPYSILDDLLVEYLESKYDSDPVGLAINLKLKDVEPFVHNTLSDLQPLNLPFEDISKKIYFSDWLATMTDAMLITMDIDLLKKSLDAFVASQSKPVSQSQSVKASQLQLEVGKLPLALQQLALAKQRSLQDGDTELADRIESKMRELIKSDLINM